MNFKKEEVICHPQLHSQARQAGQSLDGLKAKDEVNGAVLDRLSQAGDGDELCPSESHCRLSVLKQLSVADLDV